MNAKQLKNAILQLAIQGKLVPQDPTDEPASALLAQIRKEKEQLVKAGKLKKKDLETTPISDEEKPFELPDGWEWCRMDDLAAYRKGPFGSSLTKSMFVPKGADSVKVYEQKNAIQKDWRLGDYYISKEKYLGMQGFTTKPSDIIVSCAGTIGECYQLPTDAPLGIINQALMRVELYILDMADYWMLFFEDMLNHNVAMKGAGSAIKNIPPFEILKNILVPLPPLAEQRRIVAKIEELMPLVEEYGAAQEKLNRLNEALPEALKKSILQQAIQGKLVPQDANDEPASALLARIRKEKEQLVKAGKLKKKDLETTPITDDEKPFEIPESWEWVRLKDVCTKIVDGDHNPPSGLSTKTEYLMISSKNVNFDRLVELDSVRYLSKEIFEIENQRTDAKVGDILFTSVGTLGRSCIIEQNNLNICFQRSVSLINTLTYNKYLKRCLDSPYIQFFVVENATGTAQKGFYLSQMEKLVIPLPPLAEQRRIVARVEELMEMVEGMK